MKLFMSVLHQFYFQTIGIGHEDKMTQVLWIGTCSHQTSIIIDDTTINGYENAFYKFLYKQVTQKMHSREFKWINFDIKFIVFQFLIFYIFPMYYLFLKNCKI